jgi:hypothetical protein
MGANYEAPHPAVFSSVSSLLFLRLGYSPHHPILIHTGFKIMSQASLINKANSYRSDDRDCIPGILMSRRALGSTVSYPYCARVPPSVVRQPNREADQSPPSITQAKDASNFTSIHPHVVMTYPQSHFYRFMFSASDLFKEEKGLLKP